MGGHLLVTGLLNEVSPQVLGTPRWHMIGHLQRNEVEHAEVRGERALIVLRIPLLLLVLIVWGCAHPPPPAPPFDVAEVPYLLRGPAGLGADALWEHLPLQRGEAIIAVGGDILMHGRVKQSAARHNRLDENGESSNNEGFDFLFRHMRPLLARADITVLNLETPVAPRHGQAGRSFVFNVGPSMLGALVAAGVDIVTLANNHGFDQGTAGLIETLDHIDAGGLTAIGAGRSAAAAQQPWIQEVDGIRIAFLAYTQLLNNDLNADAPDKPRINSLDRDVVLEAIAAVRPLADFIVLVLHWGVEYSDEARQQEIDLAHEFLEAGVGAIFGHHPHVIQPLELYETRDGRLSVVAYSLGNFISNQSRRFRYETTTTHVGDTRDSALLEIRVARIDYGQGVERIELRGVGYTPLFTENNFIAQAKNPKLDATIQTVPNDLRIRELLARLATLKSSAQDPSAEVTDFPRRLIDLKNQLALYVNRKRAVMQRLGEDFCLPYTPPDPSPTRSE